MKTLPCPSCGNQPDVFGAAGITVCGCLGCSSKKPNGQTGRNVAEAKKNWNASVQSQLVKKLKTKRA